ncbi:MAG: hypothetical protein JO257_12355 [Deltaproteobacteria bacterium]|nr:hypothetical protein [Deltaproteobacteria bacterium]
MTFASKGLKVPQNWKNPSGDPAAKHYGDAFQPAEKMTMPAIAVPLLFQPASLNKYHTETQKMHIDKIGSFIEGITSAVCSAVQQCQATCTMSGIVIPAGPIAMGGQMTCPMPMMPTIMMSAPKNTPNLAKYSKAVAQAFDTQWQAFIASIKIPGLPLWPMFAAFPSPAAVMIPNIPLPLGTLAHAPITGSALKGLMLSNLGDMQAPFVQELFESISTGIETWFNAWLLATQVTNVMGNGPVPTMTTPVPVPGPVTGGTAVMAPGGLV